MNDVNTHVGSAINGLMNEYNIIANNLANVSTIGYKRRCNTFSKILNEHNAKTGVNADGEAKLHSVFDFSQGNIIETGRTFDLAICGKGFFVIETPQGPLYTRNGTFNVNANGQLVDSAGRAVAGVDGPITIPSEIAVSEIHISNDGSISARGTNIGKIRIVDFGENVNQLTPAGLNCFAAPKTVQPVNIDNPLIKQGYLEGSNVQMMEELVDMIMVSRLYEANMKFMTVGSDNTKSLMSVAMG